MEGRHRTRREKAQHAQAAITAYRDRMGSQYANESNFTHVADLLGDLMHWCLIHNVPFNEALDRAREYVDFES